MGVLTVMFTSGGKESIQTFRFASEDGREVEYALEQIQDGAGAALPHSGGRLVLPPGSVLWASAEGLMEGFEDDDDVDE